jgi:hypothetical protein
VPADLTRAALRRAWSVTPGIRDYIGPSENSWDFTSAGPDGVPGFDFGNPGVDVRRLATELFGRDADPAEESAPPNSAEATPAAEAAPITSPHHDLLKAPEEPVGVVEQDHAATQQRSVVSCDETVDEEGGTLVPIRRRHGGALPS